MISVIVPVHNAAETLEDAVRSVLVQTYADMELLLVDDGSTDGDIGGGRSGEGSAALCDALAETDDRIRVFHMEDLGVSAARNRGLEEARGERIAFLDADDVLHPSMLERLSGLMDQTGADYTGCGFEKRRSGEVPFGEGADPARERRESGPDETMTGEDSTYVSELRGADIILEGTLHPEHPDTRVWSKLFRREFIGRIRFREGLTIGEDMLFLADLVREDTRYVQIPDELYSYYVNPHGAMERPFAPNHMDTLRCRELAEEVIRERFPDMARSPEGTARLAAQQIIAAVLTASKIARLPAARQEDYTEEFETCRRCIRRYHKVNGVSAYLPAGYALKLRMLLYTPGVYRRLYR